MDLDLAGKRAIVAGGSRGIGLACAKALRAEGAHVAIVSRDQAALDVVAAQLSELPGDGQVLGLAADTTDPAAVNAMVRAVVDRLGGVDILINAAANPSGGSAPPKLAELADAALRAEIDTKVLGYLHGIQAVVPHMQSQGWGRIVNISGLAARSSGNTFGSIRNVAVSAMTKTLADELARTGINITVVHPGLTVTERTPGMLANLAAARGISEDEAAARMAANVAIGRSVTAEEVADVIAFLCSPRSVAINGDAIAVGGGAIGAIHY